MLRPQTSPLGAYGVLFMSLKVDEPAVNIFRKSAPVDRWVFVCTLLLKLFHYKVSVCLLECVILLVLELFYF